MQYDINRQTISTCINKISTLSLGKINKCKYLTDKGILLPNHNRIIEHALLSCPLLGKTLEKQRKKDV